MKNFSNKQNTSYLIDGQRVWHSRSVAVTGLVVCRFNHIYNFLISKRGNKAADYQDYWNLPSGYIDWNENGFEAFEREVFEETGVDISLIYPEGKILFDNEKEPAKVFTEPTENKQNISLLYTLIFERSNLPELNFGNAAYEEVSDTLWITVEDVDQYKFAFQHDELIKAAFGKISTMKL